MSRIDDLIAEYCPEGVRYVPLREVANIARGNVQPVRMTGEVVTVYSLPSFDVARSPERVPPSAIGSAKTSLTQPAVLVAKLNPHIPRVWRLDRVDESAYCSTEFFPLVPKDQSLGIGFLYYFILTRMTALAGTVTGSTNSHKRLQRGDFLNLSIPLPPLQVQREIVRILDQFTQLEAELEAELEARRKQYAYYSDALLLSGDEVPRVNLGEVASITRGASPRPIRSFITEADDGIPWIKIGDVPESGKYITSTTQRVSPSGAAKSRRIFPGDFVLSNSMSFGRPYISQIEGCIHDGWLAIADFEDSFVPDYLYYLLRSAPIQAEFARRASAGTVKNLKADTVKSVSVSLPSRKEQLRIVDLLDKFDALVNDLSVGLPAELAARRKQYEYYRDKLLAFKELPA